MVRPVEPGKGPVAVHLHLPVALSESEQGIIVAGVRHRHLPEGTVREQRTDWYPQAMLVRPATPRDARAIARVQVRGWQVGYRGLVPDEYLARLTVESATNRWLASLAEPGAMQHLVAEDDDGTVVGWSAFGANQAELSPNTGELGALYVDPSFWDRGAGGLLLAASEQGLSEAGYQRAVLWTLAANARTRGFYEHRGWCFDGATDIHRSGAEVLRYAKELSVSVDRGDASA